MGWNSHLNSTGLIKLNHFTDIRKTYLYIVVTSNLPGILDHGSIDEINTLPRILDHGPTDEINTLPRILDRGSMSLLLAPWFSCSKDQHVVTWRTGTKPY